MSLASSSTDKPTVVLVHGAFAESSSWDGVISLLVGEGFPVVAAAVPLRGVRSRLGVPRGILDGIEGSLVLVGHSYGGIVIGVAAEGNDRVTALVFVAATRSSAARTPRLDGPVPGWQPRRDARRL